MDDVRTWAVSGPIGSHTVPVAVWGARQGFVSLAGCEIDVARTSALNWEQLNARRRLDLHHAILVPLTSI